jgi:hypothetical protein
MHTENRLLSQAWAVDLQNRPLIPQPNKKQSDLSVTALGY